MIRSLRQLRRQCADTSRRVQRETGGQARNFNCAASYVLGGDFDCHAPNTAYLTPKNESIAPPLRRVQA